MREEITHSIYRQNFKVYMNIIKQIVAILVVLTFSLKCFSQITDTISKKSGDSLNFPKRAVAFVADKFAVVRPLNIEFLNTAAYNYKSGNAENILPNGRVSNFQQIKISANINFIKRKKWMLGATAGYRQTSAEVLMPQSAIGDQLNITKDFNYLFSSLNMVYFSSLFRKRMIYSSSIMVDGSDKHLERWKGMFTGTMVLKANQKTKMTAGILVNVDPSSQSPIIPTFSYEHKFNNGFIVDIVLPRSIQLRKFVFNNGRISVGSELDQTSFYLYHLDGKNQKYEYRQLDINSGLTYEHAIGKYFLLSARSGMKLTPSGRVFKKEDSFGDPVYRMSPDPAFYFNVGLSFNPFSVFGKKR